MNTSRPSRSQQTVETNLAVLEALERPELIARWQELVGRAPPANASVTFLRRAIAYEIQTKALGAIPKRVERVFKAALKATKADAEQSFHHIGSIQANTSISCPRSAQDPKLQLCGPLEGSPVDGPSARAPQPTLTPKLADGTQLVREWNGRTWQVAVVEGGFVCKGKRYRSLSAIAKMITGAHWSGPRFFGLRS